MPSMLRVCCRELFRSVSSTVSSANSKRVSDAPEKVLERLLSLDAEIRTATEALGVRQQLRREIAETRAQISGQDQALQGMEEAFRDAEADLAAVVRKAKQKLKQIEAAEAAKTTDEDLLRYAYDVGTRFGVTAPDSWTPDSQQRPYPIEMNIRAGHLMAHQAPPLSRD
eukprot:gene968-9209_t